MTLFLFFFFGSIVGSYFETTNQRIARDDNLILDSNKRFLRSQCDDCKRELSWLDLFPIFSFLLLKGKCRYCKKPIKIDHLISEFLFGLIFCLLILSDNSFNLILTIPFFSFLFAIALFDYKYFLIPKIYLLFFILISFFSLYFEGSLTNIIFASVMTLTVFIAKQIMDRIMKRETLGNGDLFLIFGLGLFHPPLEFSFALLLASSLGIVIFALKNLMKNPIDKVPLGTLLAIGSISSFSFF